MTEPRPPPASRVEPPDEPTLHGIARQRLRERLLARIAGPAQRVPAPWVPTFARVQVQTLYRDAGSGQQITLWRLAPGARIPRHTHRAREECLVLEGEIFHAGERHAAGDFLVAEPGSRHRPFDSPKGALLLIRGEPVPRLSAPLRWLLRLLRV